MTKIVRWMLVTVTAATLTLVGLAPWSAASGPQPVRSTVPGMDVPPPPTAQHVLGAMNAGDEG